MFIFVEKPFSIIRDSYRNTFADRQHDRRADRRADRQRDRQPAAPTRASAFLAFLVLVLLAPMTPVLGMDCASTSLLGSGGLAFGELEAAGPCFEVEVHEPGILVLGLFTDRPASLQPAFVAPTVHRTAQDLVLAVPAGRHLFHVAADDGAPLGRQRLVSRFVSRDRWLASRPTKSETDNELEVDPDPFLWSPCTEGSETDNELEVDPDPLMASPGIALSETDNELEVDPDPLLWLPGAAGTVTDDDGRAKSETDNELEVDPDPLLAGPLGAGDGCGENALRPTHDLARLPILLAGVRDLLCGASALGIDGSSDDHGDLFACATPVSIDRIFEGMLGASARQLDGRQLDDSDTFVFRVHTPTSIELRLGFEPSSSDGLLHASLYDRSGQRLDRVAGSEGGLELGRTLMPGLYFLRFDSTFRGPYAAVIGVRD